MEFFGPYDCCVVANTAANKHFVDSEIINEKNKLEENRELNAIFAANIAFFGCKIAKHTKLI